MLTPVFFLLVISFAVGDKAVLAGTGGNFAWPLISDWIYAYELNHKTVEIQYNVTVASVYNKDLSSDQPKYDFYATLGLMTRDDPALKGKQDEIQFIPFSVGAMVPTYNIPSLAFADGSPGKPHLILSTDVLADIYRGRIEYWNDSRITQDNPDAILPEAPITRVLRKDSTGFTYAIMAACSLFVDDWEYTPANFWPSEIINLTNTHMANDNFGMIGDVSAIPNSIGYMSLPQMLTQRIAIANSFAKMKNKNGEIVSSDEKYILLAQQNKTFDEYLWGNFMNQPHGWPITVTSFIAIRKDMDSFANCASLRELFSFLYWTNTNEDAIARAGPNGYSRWSDALNKQILDYLTTATCGGDQVLAIRYTAQHEGKSFMFFLVLALVLFGAAIVLGAVWHYLNQSKCSKVVIMYQCILLIGIGMTYISVVFWYLVPDSRLICQLRIWLTTLGYTFILTAMFERTWQIRKVYGKVLSGNLRASVAGFLEVGGGIGCVILVQLIILIVWTTIDPFQSINVVGSTPFEATYECASAHPNVWLSLESVYFGILLIWAVFVIYSTWSIRTFIVESRWILIAMYNVLLFLALLATLYATMNLDDDKMHNITVPFILLSTTSIVIAVYMPSILKELKIIVSTDSMSNGSHRTKSNQTAEESHVVKSKSEEKGDQQAENNVPMNYM